MAACTIIAKTDTVIPETRISDREFIFCGEMEKSMCRLVLFPLLLHFLTHASAQEPSLIHYGVEDGLPSNLIYSMTQDKEGFLWFGTDKGLARFDGKRFHVFEMSDGLPDMEILNVEPDSRGRLWISPFKQNPCYWENGTFHSTTSDRNFKNVLLQAASVDFQEDRAGRIWMFNGEKSAYCYDGKESKKIDFNFTTCSLFQVEGQLYMITLGEILALSDQKPPEVVFGLKRYLGHTKLTHLSGVGVHNNQILICNTNKLLLVNYDRGNFTIQDSLVGYTGRISTTQSGDFVLTTYNQGCLFFGCSQGRIVLKKSLLLDRKINMTFEDNQGMLWFCTPDEGVYALPLNTPHNYFEKYPDRSHNIMSLSIGANHEIIAGNDEGGLFLLKNDQIDYRHLEAITGNNRILKTIITNNGKIFIAGDENIYALDKGDTLERYPFISTPKSILYFEEKLWVAASRHLGYFQGSEKAFHYVVSIKRFTSIEQDQEGYIWAGGMDGIYSSVDSFSTNWGEIFPNLKTRIIAIARATPGFLWISSADHGLLRMAVSKGKVREVEVMNEQLSKPISNIKALFFDHHDNLWMGTNKGVFKLNPELSVSHLDKHDGLPDNDVNTLLVQEDTLWVGTTKGLTKIQLGEILQKSWFPTYVSMLQYRLNNTDMSIPFFADFNTERKVVLPPNANLIEIKLSGLDYASKGNIQFEYVQKECFPPISSITVSNLVSFLFSGKNTEKAAAVEGGLSLGTRLRPGKYLFQFTAFNTKGQKSTKPDLIYVVQQPYWYETIWFWLGVWLSVFIVSRMLYKNHMAYRELNASVSKLRLQAIQAQLNPHFIGNSIYAIQQFFYPPNPEKASEYIELFNRLLRQSMLMSEQHFVQFRDDLEYYRDYLSMIKLRFGERFSYLISGEGDIPPEILFPAMILQPIIENATIHGLSPDGSSNLKITFSKQGGIIRCAIEDNGEGIQAAQARNLKNPKKRISKGLELLHQKVNTINRLYQTNIQLKIFDLKDIDPSLRGTRAEMSYYYSKVTQEITPPETLL